MRTVQETIRSLDKEELAQAYALIYPKKIEPFYEEEDVDGETCGEIKKWTRNRIYELIDLVCGLETRKSADGRDGIIFGYPYPIGEYYGENMLQELVYVDELLRQEESATAYSYKLSEWEEVLGWRVADTKFTQRNRCKIMALALYEMTWFGYTPEDVRRAREEMYAEVEELERKAEEEKGKSNDKAEPRKEQGAKKASPFQERMTPETLLRRQYEEAKFVYSMFLRSREIYKILEGLPRRKKGKKAKR